MMPSVVSKAYGGALLDTLSGLLVVLHRARVYSVGSSYVRKLVTELSGGVFGYLDSVLERHSFDEYGELI